MLYIHQYPDWTHFRFDSKRVMESLGKTRLAEGKLISIMDLCGLKDLEAKIVSKDIAANFAIDNIELDDAGIKRQSKCFLDAIQNARATLNPERLFNWHSCLTQDKESVFRTGESRIEVICGDSSLEFSGPSADRINTEMANFITWFEITPMDGVIKAAIAHFWLLSLRPFEKANGRIARIVTIAQLARAEGTDRCQYALNEQILKNRDEYFTVLHKTQLGNGDLTEWILWFLKQIQGAIQASEQLYESIKKRLHFEISHTGAFITQREQQLLSAIFTEAIPAEFTAKDVAEIFQCSHDTALREIQSLLAKKLLKSSQKGGRSQKYSLFE